MDKETPGLDYTEPLRLPAIVLRDVMVYPETLTCVYIARPASIAVLREHYRSAHPYIVFVPQLDGAVETPQPADLYDVAVVGRVSHMMELPDRTRKVIVEGLRWGRVKDVTYDENLGYSVTFTAAPEIAVEPVEADLVSKLLERAESDLVRLTGRDKQLQDASIPKEARNPVGRLFSMLSQSFISMDRRIDILQMPTMTARCNALLESYGVEFELRDLDRRLQIRVKQQLEAGNRRYFIQEQIKTLKRELEGEAEEEDTDNYLTRLDKEGEKFPEEVKKTIREEVRRLNMLQGSASEAGVIKTYLDTLFDIPWTKKSELKTDLPHAREVLDADHYGLEKVKDRIMEYLAVQRRVESGKAPILCFVGAPGVGKTSLGESIARAVGREYVRVALGGVYDESEIRGHRRTYVGSMPGRFIKALTRAKVNNPLILLDEIDKIGKRHNGDPSAALLEVLDPEQNKTFEDHYVDLPVDLSKVMFVATSNSYDIPAPLLDRMEVISLSGYTEDEKLHIAQRHLLPKILRENGVKKNEIEVTEDAVLEVIRRYTSEAGVRNLERELGKIVRKIVLKNDLAGRKAPKSTVVTAADAKDYLGPAKYTITTADKADRIGIVNGLAWTSAGGDILLIETLRYPGRGAVSRTGSLGDVMKESVEAARSLVRSRAADWGIRADLFGKTDLHVHFPEGAIPKDGPSAGCAITTAMVSIYTGIPVRSDVAMTGEITLRGDVTAIGGLKEKILAALRGGIKKVLIPAENEKDLVDLPKDVLEKIEVVPVKRIDEVLAHALSRQPEPLTEAEAKEAEAALLAGAEKKPEARPAS